MEPIDYFRNLKTQLKNAELIDFNSQLNVIKNQIIAANKVGQQSFLHRLSFTYKTIFKEQEAVACGITRYLLKDEVLKFLDKVTPKNSVKLIELSRYPRPIPLDVLEKIDAVKSKAIFDDYFVVFTDFTDNTYETKQEKEMVERNRDPVVFGYFYHEKTSFRHDRLYFIADWIDDYCDLDFAKLLTEMSNNIPEFTDGILKPGEIDAALMIDNVDKIVEQSFNDMNKDKYNRYTEQVSNKPKWKQIWDILTK